MSIKFVLDENVRHNIRVQLNRRFPDMEVLKIGDYAALPRSTPDPDILIWAEAHDYILVTHDVKSMPIHIKDHLAAGRHLPGVLYIRPHISTGELLDELGLIWEAGDPRDYYDLGRYIPE